MIPNIVYDALIPIIGIDRVQRLWCRFERKHRLGEWFGIGGYPHMEARECACGKVQETRKKAGW